MKIFSLHRSLDVTASIDEVWPFFSDARNLGELTPPYLAFKILTPMPIGMQVGTLIDYQITLHHISMKWRTEITAWEPGVRFIDEQLKGPYRLWVHEHRFEPIPGGTRLIDDVRYAVWGSSLVNNLAIKGSLKKIFDYRTEVMAARFGLRA